MNRETPEEFRAKHARVLPPILPRPNGHDESNPPPISEAVQPLPPTDERALLLSAWARSELPLRRFLLGNVLCTTSRWLMYGETGVGKTLLAADIGAAIAAGEGFLNWEGSGKPARVMYLDGEMPAETFKERMEVIAKRYGSDLAFYGYNRDVLGDGEMPPLNTPEGEKWLWREIEAVKPDAIAFDSIMCLLAGSMSEEESWAPVKAMARKISSRRIGQIWLHHTGHDTSKGFGTKTREWEMDTVVALTKALEDDGEIAMEFKKARLRTPEMREQFEARKITCGPAGWIIIGSGVSKPRAGRSQELVTVRHALVDAYNRLSNGISPSPGFDGQPVRKVTVEAIREELKSRGLLQVNESGGLRNSGRSSFHRAKADIIAAKSHIESEGLLWRLTPNV
jgi:hypothetical protein